jgi:SAM-dependent methyltransferase
MTSAEGGPWPDIAHAYDVAAETYAATFAAELDGKPFDRALLDRYAAALAGRGEVWDVGCGAAGHLTRYLADRGVAVCGADLSPASVAVARRRQPGLAFRVADMCDLPTGDGSLAGIVAFYSVIHLPRPRIPVALAEFRRALAPGGGLLVAMHGGTGEVGSAGAFGHPVEVRATLVAPGELAGLVAAAGFAVRERHARDPYPGEYPSQRLYVWAEAAPPPR